MGDMLFLKCIRAFSQMRNLLNIFSLRHIWPFLGGYIVGIIFSKILRTVSKIAASYLYDMIWNLSKNLNFF